MSYTVRQLARLARVSVRTLHYYDEIGLLKPARVASQGYRYYERAELMKLQQILFFRELGFSLRMIERIVHSPYFDMEQALNDHKRLIRMKRDRLDRLIATIDTTITTMHNNDTISDTVLYDAFRDDDVRQYQEEVQKRWGNTDAYKQSMQKVGRMSVSEMEKLKADEKAHTQAIADAMDSGITSEKVQSLIAQSHKRINFFYDCSIEMFRNLGTMYVDDPRFAAYYNNIRPGLAVFVRDAIWYYCDTQEGKK